MAQGKAPEVEQPEKDTARLIPEERLQELLNILLPYGYSNYDGNKYTGVSPYIGKTRNIITIVANDPAGWDSVLSICMDCFDENEDEENSLGFYKGVMKVIAPELHSDGNKFSGGFNVLDFNFAEDEVQDNRFPVKTEYLKKNGKTKGTMAKRKTTAIFFDDLKEDAQKRIIAHEMATIIDCEPDEVEVENVTVDDDAYGYDEDPKKQELLEHVHAEINGEAWLMVWDCFAHEFITDMNENQK